MSKLRWFAWLIPWLASSAVADEAASQAVRAALAKIDPTIDVTSVDPSPIPGLHAAVVGGSRGYVTGDGRYFIAGDMFDVKSRRNLSEERRAQERRAIVATLDAASEIVFAPPEPKYTLTVFTDVDCPYCRKLHAQIDEYVALGIAVHYVAFPRNGPNTPAWKTMENVWCARDRKDALSRAKRGEAVAAVASCTSDAVKRHFDVAMKLGLRGTPALVLEDGTLIDGYLPPPQLLVRLKMETSQ